MGYLTPILIRNDDVHRFTKRKYQKKLCEELKRVSMETQESKIDYSHESLGTAHASENRTIVIHGNTWHDISRDGYGDFKRTDQVYIDYLKACVEIAQRHVTKLKKKIREFEKNK